jgi:hypothetical protein
MVVTHDCPIIELHALLASQLLYIQNFSIFDWSTFVTYTSLSKKSHFEHNVKKKNGFLSLII